jgi:hypothetical protein
MQLLRNCHEVFEVPKFHVLPSLPSVRQACAMAGAVASEWP